MAYRSRHPELIAFSNHQFYDNKLIVGLHHGVPMAGVNPRTRKPGRGLAARGFKTLLPQGAEGG